MSYVLGQPLTLSVTFTDLARIAADPDSVTCTVGDADGSPTIYTYGVGGNLVRDGVGAYHLGITPDAAGTWFARWEGVGTIDAVEDQEFDVVASAQPWDPAGLPLYASVSQFKRDVGFDPAKLGASADLTSIDQRFRELLDEASRYIDRRTKRRFYSVTETRVFRPDNNYHLDVGDLLSVTSMASDNDGDFDYETTWTSATDYFLGPLGASSIGRPYRRIEVTPLTGRYWLPQWRSTLLGDRNYGLSQPSVQIAGVWGYCLTGRHPAEIRRACLLWANRLYHRPGAFFGVLENSAGGPPIRIGPDKDFEEMIRDYILQEPLFV